MRPSPGTARPAGLLWNRASVGGGSPDEDLRIALEQLYAAVTDGRAVRPVFVLSGRAALFLSRDRTAGVRRPDADRWHDSGSASRDCA